MNEPSSGEAGPERLVFLLHGILINRWFLAPLSAFLRRRGFQVVNHTYPSTRKTIQAHAADLGRAVERATASLREGGTPYQVDFVTHSMGGLVARWLLTHQAVPAVRRLVQLVPPNCGSSKARRFRRNALFRLLYGTRAGAQLAEDPSGIFAECGIPSGVEMGILAGVGGSLLTIPTRALAGTGPHDGVVTLEETRLPGVVLKEVPYGHTTILFRRGAMEEVAHFLEHGRFLP
jgi:hypothetical protein